MRRFVPACAAGVLTLGALAGGPALGAVASDTNALEHGASARVMFDQEFVVLCSRSRTPLDVDPIRFPGDPHEGHLHEFFGNRYTNENSTGYSLRNAVPIPPDSTATTCGYDKGAESPDRKNQSAYWVPTLFAPNQTHSRPGDYLVPPSHSRNYYRAAGIADVNSIVAFPPDFGMIAGNPDAANRDDGQRNVIAWSCVSTAGGEGEYFSIQQAIQQATSTGNTCPDDPGEQGYTGMLRLEVYFPNCWDGNEDWPWSEPWTEHGPGDDSTRAHMRYAWEKPDGTPEYGGGVSFEEASEECPAGFGSNPGVDGQVLPALKTGFRWYVANVNMTNAYIASDDHPGHVHGKLTSGRTAHADFMNGWDQATLEDLIDCKIKDIHSAC